MIKPETIPHGLALIARKAWAEGIGPTNDDDWNAAIAAVLNAWPMGSVATPDAWVRCRRDGSTIILPLPTEKPDDKA